MIRWSGFYKLHLMQIVDQTLRNGVAATLSGSQQLHLLGEKFCQHRPFLLLVRALSSARKLIVDNWTLLGDTMVWACMRLRSWQSFLQCWWYMLHEVIAFGTVRCTESRLYLCAWVTRVVKRLAGSVTAWPTIDGSTSACGHGYRIGFGLDITVINRLRLYTLPLRLTKFKFWTALLYKAGKHNINSLQARQVNDYTLMKAHILTIFFQCNKN